MGFTPMSRTITLSKGGLDIDETELTPQQYDSLVAIAGNRAHKVVSRMLTPEFYDQPLEAQRVAICKVVQSQREAATKELRSRMILDGTLDVSINLSQ